MKIHFEQSDYQIIEKKNSYGFTHEVPQLADGRILRRAFTPYRHQVVMTEKEGRLIPICILDGAYEINGRISNAWTWLEINEDLTVGEKRSGYGCFYECPVKLKAKEVIQIEIEEKEGKTI